MDFLNIPALSIAAVFSVVTFLVVRFILKLRSDNKKLDLVFAAKIAMKLDSKTETDPKVASEFLDKLIEKIEESRERKPAEISVKDIDVLERLIIAKSELKTSGIFSWKDYLLMPTIVNTEEWEKIMHFYLYNSMKEEDFRTALENYQKAISAGSIKLK